MIVIVHVADEAKRAPYMAKERDLQMIASSIGGIQRDIPHQRKLKA